MILNTEKRELAEQADFDEPPTYTDAVGPTNTTTSWAREPKGYPPPGAPDSTNAAASSSKSIPKSASGSTFSSAAAWFSFGALSRTDREVKATVLGLVRLCLSFSPLQCFPDLFQPSMQIRDVVKQSPGPAAVAIFQSCAEACRARNLQFDALLQEASIEGHTPLYWAILKRKSSDELGLLDLLLSFPLTEATRSDASVACMLQSDNELFQRIRQSPNWRTTSTYRAEEMLLGRIPEDTVSVVNDTKAADTGAFKAEFHLPEFQKRMRVSRGIQVEFVARGEISPYPPTTLTKLTLERLWALTFSRDNITNTRLSERRRAREGGSAGGGYVGISLLDQSPPTPFTGRIIIEEAKTEPSRKPVSIILRSGHSDLGPLRWHGDSRAVCSLSLADVPGGASLQHE